MAYFDQNNRQDNRKSYSGKKNFGGGGGRDRKMYPAVCHDCGRECQVPFYPDGSKPVYCSSCFEKNQGGFGQKQGGFDGRQFDERKSNSNQTNEILASINNKLGKILDLMMAAKKPDQKEAEIKPVKKVKKVVRLESAIKTDL